MGTSEDYGFGSVPRAASQHWFPDLRVKIDSTHIRAFKTSALFVFESL